MNRQPKTVATSASATATAPAPASAQGPVPTLVPVTPPRVKRGPPAARYQDGDRRNDQQTFTPRPQRSFDQQTFTPRSQGPRTFNGPNQGRPYNRQQDYNRQEGETYERPPSRRVNRDQDSTFVPKRRPYVPNVNVNITMPHEGSTTTRRGPRTTVPQQEGFAPIFPARVERRAPRQVRNDPTQGAEVSTEVSPQVRTHRPYEEREPEFVLTKNGAIAIRNIQRLPVVLYVQMWERLRTVVNSEAFQQFIDANEASLKRFTAETTQVEGNETVPSAENQDEIEEQEQ